jgi:hypothetical protein
MASIRGDKLTIKLQQNSSGVVNKVIAATTSCNAEVSAEALDATSQDSGIYMETVAGKLTGTISGDYLTALDGEQYTNLYTHAGSGDTIEWELYRDGSLFLNGTGVISSISQTGGNSDTLTTGAYSMTVQADDQVGSVYGPELHTDANAASDPNGNEADAITGWTPALLSGTGSNVFESQNSVVNTGTYALHADANDTPSNGARFGKEFTVDDGGTYNVRFNWRHIGSGGDWNLILLDDSGSTYPITEIENTDTTWASVNINHVVDGTTLEVRFQEWGGSNDGGIYVDNLSVKKVL